jgi:Nuclease-related domain
LLLPPPVATVHGEESRWLRTLAAKRAVALGAYGAILTGTVIGAAVYDPRLAVAVLVAGIAFVRRRRGLARRYRNVMQGAAGERDTATMLALLPAGFAVVNDLAFSRFNVDHVVIGPTGVWAVETKSHPGLVEEQADGVRLNGRPMYRDPRRQARAGAAAIAELLQRETGRRWWVEALVCFPHATVVANGSAADARVVNARQLLTRLRLAPTMLAADERDRIVGVLIRRRTQDDRRGAFFHLPAVR